MAELVNMLFVLWTLSGARNYVLNGARIPPWKGALLRDILGHAWACQWSVYSLSCYLQGGVAVQPLATSSNLLLLMIKVDSYFTIQSNVGSSVLVCGFVFKTVVLRCGNGVQLVLRDQYHIPKAVIVKAAANSGIPSWHLTHTLEYCIYTLYSCT